MLKKHYLTAKHRNRSPPHSQEARYMRRIQVYVVLPPRLMLLDIAGALEVLRRANREQSNVRFDVEYVAASASILGSIGIMITSIKPLPRVLLQGAMIILAGDVDEVMSVNGRVSRDTSKADRKHYAATVKW